MWCSHYDQCTFDNSGAPTDSLTDEAKLYVSTVLGSSPLITTISQIIETRDENVYSFIQKVIDAVNEKAPSADHQV